MSVGTFAVVSLMTGALVDEKVNLTQCINGTNILDSEDDEALPIYDPLCVDRLKGPV